MQWLQRQPPTVIWDASTHRPPLHSDSDWIQAGRIVSDALIAYDTNSIIQVNDVTNSEWRKQLGAFVAVRYIVRKNGQVELGTFAYALCHTRIMANGEVLTGALGNFPFDRAFAFAIRTYLTVQEARSFNLFRNGAPWMAGGQNQDSRA